MIYLINESSFLLRVIQNFIRVENINFTSTKGFLFDYKIDKNMNLYVMPKEDKKFIIEYLSTLSKVSDDVVIATDHDPAGEMIALEVLYLIPNAKRLRIPFDSLLKYEKITPGLVLKNSDRLFNPKMAKHFMNEKLKNNPLMKKKRNLLGELLQNNINEIIIPNEYLKDE